MSVLHVTTSETGFLLSTLDTVIKEGFWIGLINPMGVACQDAVCLDQLSWVSDGNNFTNMHSAPKVSCS